MVDWSQLTGVLIAGGIAVLTALTSLVVAVLNHFRKDIEDDEKETKKDDQKKDADD